MQIQTTTETRYSFTFDDEAIEALIAAAFAERLRAKGVDVSPAKVEVELEHSDYRCEAHAQVTLKTASQDPS